MRVNIGRILLAALFVQGTAASVTPEVSIGLNSETFHTGVLGGIEPAFKWRSTGQVGEYDIDVRTIIRNKHD